MKVLLFSLVVCLNVFVTKAQKVIINPEVGYAFNSTNLLINKVVINDTATVLYFTTKATPGNWINIPKNTYIQINDTFKLYIKDVIGIPINKRYTMPASGEVDYALVFPTIPLKTKTIDYGEEEANGWKIFDIALEKSNAILPSYLKNEWYNVEKGIKELGFYKKAMVLNSTVWEYQFIKNSNNKILIKAKNPANKSADFIIDKITDSTIKLSFATTSKYYSLAKPKSAIAVEANEYHAPLLKEGFVTIKGYIVNYTPRVGFKTMSLISNNNFTANQSTYVIEINPNGYFETKLAIPHPQNIMLSTASSFNGFQVEPFKELFLVFDNNDVKYLGELGKINEDLTIIRKGKGFYDYEKIVDSALTLTPDLYKKYVDELKEKADLRLDALLKTNTICIKAYQVAKLNNLYGHTNNKMEYHWNYARAYSNKFKAVKSDNIKIPPYPANYYNFITSNLVNKELALLSEDYNTFINRFKFIDTLRNYGAVYTNNYNNIYAALEKSNLINENDKKFKLLIEKDGLSINAKPKDSLVVQKFNADHGKFIGKFVNKIVTNRYYEALDSALEINKGLAIDIMRAQDILGKIAQELTPVNAVELKQDVTVIDNPFIRNYILEINKQVQQQIEANKKNDGYFVNTIPNVEADKIFDAVMSKYKGKVVYVDFWATWCGPCRSGIAEIKPLKEEMKSKNIAFVYITNETSPVETYKNMIPEIKGEHYRLKQDQWHYLASKFNISGIPHYVLVDKNGKVINGNLAHMQNGGIKDMVEKYL